MATNKLTTPAEDIHLCMVVYVSSSYQGPISVTSQTVRLKTSELESLRKQIVGDNHGHTLTNPAANLEVIVLKTIKPKRAATYGEEAC